MMDEYSSSYLKANKKPSSSRNSLAWKFIDSSYRKKVFIFSFAYPLYVCFIFKCTTYK